MSDNIIMKDDGTPFVTIESAKSKRTRMGKEGLDCNIVQVDGGFVLERRDYEKPKKRIPIGTRNVLTLREEDKDHKYKYRIVNDDGDRIRMFRDAGWDVIEKREGMQIGDPEVGVASQLGSLATKTVGQNKIAYVMRIKREFYEEDQERKAEKIRQTESALRSEDKKEGRYGSVKIGDRPEY